MYAKRLRTYKRIGFELITNGILAKQNVNAIYDSGSYTDVFEQDIVESYSRIWEADYCVKSGDYQE